MNLKVLNVYITFFVIIEFTFCKKYLKEYTKIE